MLLLENGAKEILKKPTYHQKLYVSIFKYTHFLCLSISHTHTELHLFSSTPFICDFAITEGFVCVKERLHAVHL